MERIEAELDRRGAAVVTVEGGCMEPAIRSGQTVIVHRSRPPRAGDAVLLDAAGVLEVHRLGPSAGPWVLHKGDASPCWGLARRDQVLGLVSGVPSRGVSGPGPLLALLLQVLFLFANHNSPQRLKFANGFR